MTRKVISAFVILAFLTTAVPVPGRAGEIFLPAPGARMAVSPAFMPPMILGITVDAVDPMKFNFLIDQGDVGAGHARPVQDEALKEEYTKLIKYFLASLTIPEKDLWVNLSPYEGQRIIPQAFGQTEMGRDLLGQDYVLKQITASLIYPESELGKKFWADVYKKAHEQYGTTNIPVNTFNKVWIVPDEAMVYEHDGSAFVVKSHLKVMLEQDYLALQHNMGEKVKGWKGEESILYPFTQTANQPSLHPRADQPAIYQTNQLGSQVVREIILPALEKEVNEGKNFALLRQINNALILATWYKRALKESLLSRFYVDKAKTSGLEYGTPTRGHVAGTASASNVSPSRLPTNQALKAKAPEGTNDIDYIYNQYLQAFKKGVYNYIKEEADPYTRQTVPRKYFSGGFVGDYVQVVQVTRDQSQVSKDFTRRVKEGMDGRIVDVAMEAQDAAVIGSPHDRAMTVTLSPIALDGVRQLKRWMEEAVQQIKDARADWKGQKIQINEYGQRLKQAANVREQYSSFLKDDPFLSKLRWIFMGGGMRLPKQDPNNSDEKERYIGIVAKDPTGSPVIGVTDNSQYMTSLEVSNTFGSVTGYADMIDVDQDFFLSEIDKIIDDVLIRGQNVIDLLAKVESSQPGAEFETVNVIGIDENLKPIVISIVDPRLTVVQPDQVAADKRTENSRINVLVVDDTQDIRDLNVEILEGAGYTVTSAANGREALQMVKESPGKFPLIVSDVDMPVMDGFELAQSVRQESPGTRFIIATGRLTEDIPQEVRDNVGKDGSNISHILLKPFTADALLGTVQAATADLAMTTSADRRVDFTAASLLGVSELKEQLADGLGKIRAEWEALKTGNIRPKEWRTARVAAMNEAAGQVFEKHTLSLQRAQDPFLQGLRPILTNGGANSEYSVAKFIGTIRSVGNSVLNLKDGEGIPRGVLNAADAALAQGQRALGLLEEIAQRRPDRAMAADQKAYRVLFVDDDPITVKTTAMLLRYEGYEVDTAADGQEALTKFSAGRYSALIVDGHMPVMTGQELIERVREVEKANGTTSPVPFIIQSGTTDLDFSDEMRRRALAVFDKPYDVLKMIELLKLRQEDNTLHPVDAAMNAVAKDVGGIDLNPANLNLRIKRDGKGVPLPVGRQDMGQLNNIEGLVPVIIKIVPATYIPALSDVLATVN
jgi:CheY-like chemotaxis protein